LNVFNLCTKFHPWSQLQFLRLCPKRRKRRNKRNKRKKLTLGTPYLGLMQAACRWINGCPPLASERRGDK
jgi:hypothetical protein